MSKLTCREKCILKNCGNGPSEHLYISGECYPIDEDDEVMDLPDDINDIDGANHAMSQILYADEILPIPPCNTSNIVQSSSDNHAPDNNQAINLFFEKWASVDHQDAINENPAAPIYDIIKNPHFSKYKKMFEKTLMVFHKFERSQKLHLILDFISTADIRTFINFDILIKGADIMSHAVSKEEVRTLQVTLDSHLSSLQNNTSLIAGYMENIDQASENLRSAINDVSEVAKKLQAEKKLLDLKTCKISASDEPSKPKDMTSTIQYIQNGLFKIVLTPSHKIDSTKTESINVTMTVQHKLLLDVLNLCSADCIKYILSIDLETLIKIMGNPSGVDKKLLATKVWTHLKQHYKNLSQASIQSCTISNKITSS